jgi:hypothetical protein
MDIFGIRVRKGQEFPNLNASNHRKTSEPSLAYNCFGWAIVGREVLMGPRPNYIWPDGAPRDMRLSSFTIAVAAFDWSPCTDGKLEPDVEKIVLYGLPEYVDHAARQLPNGHWTSKRGLEEDDIEHDTPECISGGAYGSVLAFFAKRKVPLQAAILVTPHEPSEQ